MKSSIGTYHQITRIKITMFRMSKSIILLTINSSITQNRLPKSKILIAKQMLRYERILEQIL